MAPLVSLSALKNSIQDKILLTATGLSTRNIDFSLLSKTVPVVGVNGAWRLADRLYFLLYTTVDIEFFDKKSDVIRTITSQSEIPLFTTMHGITRTLDRYGDAPRCRLALIEDDCYKIHRPEVVNGAIKRTCQQNVTMCSHPQHPDICFSTGIRQDTFDTDTVVHWAL